MAAGLSPNELYSTAGKYGLRTLVEPHASIVDLVLVHGLTGNRENTWTEKKGKILWAERLLPTDLPQARIFTFGYDADVVRVLKTTSSNIVRDHGKALANDVAIRRMRTKSNNRPIIFIAHSLGGLVCEQALLICRGSAEKHMEDLLEATSGIVFMGTPHAGSDLAKWTKVLTGLASMLRTANSEIVGALKPGSETLACLQQDFHTMLDARQKNGKKPIKIFCFFEELGVPGVGEIVPKHSAILSAYPNRGIHANHVDMTRYSDLQDAGYRAVSDQLWLWVNDIEREIEEEEEKSKAAETAELLPEERREARASGIGSMRGLGGASDSGGSSNGIVSTGRNASFRDNYVTGRDSTINLTK